MKWSELKDNSVKLDIARNRINHCDKFEDLTYVDICKLNELTEFQLFEAWCNWQGLINWSSSISKAYNAIFKGKEN